MSRRRSFIPLAVAVTLAALAAGACNEDETATDAAPVGGAMSVPASEESRNALGVDKWYVEPGDPGKLWVAGMDGERHVVLDVVIAIETTEPAHGSIAYDVHGRANVHVNFHWTGDDLRSNAEQLSEADQNAALEVFARMEGDLRAATETASASPGLTPRGGHVGGPLVRSQQDVLRPGECLLDNAGQYCSWETVKIAAAMLKTGTCLTKPWNCVLGPKALFDAAEQANAKGCKYRPCPR